MVAHLPGADHGSEGAARCRGGAIPGSAGSRRSHAGYEERGRARPGAALCSATQATAAAAVARERIDEEFFDRKCFFGAEHVGAGAERGQRHAAAATTATASAAELGSAIRPARSTTTSTGTTTECARTGAGGTRRAARPAVERAQGAGQNQGGVRRFSGGGHCSQRRS